MTFARRTYYADIRNIEIDALLHRRFRFADEEQALARLARITRRFTQSRRHEARNTGAALFWIRGFEVTEEEEANLYLGNYAQVTITRREDGCYTLTAVKREMALKHHPCRKRPQKRCPNWGHPVLRGVKKGRVYATIAEAEEELAHLHLEYPETTIPGDHKLYAMIFDRTSGEKDPVGRYVLNITPAPEEAGGGDIASPAPATPTGKEPTGRGRECPKASSPPP